MKTLTFIVTTILIAVFVNITAHAKTWYVDDDLQDCPDADFTIIQEAVDAAGNGDTIVVCFGTYTENIEARDKNGLTIQAAEGQETPIVDGGIDSGEITLLVVNSEGVNLDNLKLINGGPVIYYSASTGSISGNVISGGAGTYGDGIEIANYSLVIIEDNTIKDNERFGIGAWDSEVTISGNTITNGEPVISCYASTGHIFGNVISGGAGTYGDGIEIGYSLVTIEDNTIKGNERLGIGAWESEVTISENTITNNEKDGVYVQGPDTGKTSSVDLPSAEEVIVESSPEVEKKVIYHAVPSLPAFEAKPDDRILAGVFSHASNPGLATIQENEISNNNGVGINCNSSTGTIQENEISNNNGVGISYDSSTGTITNNVVDGHDFGIFLSCCYSCYNIVQDNNIYGNDVGICIGSASRNTIRDNRIYDNGWGILLMYTCYRNGEIIPKYNNILRNNISNSEYDIIFLEGRDNNIYLNNLTSADKIYCHSTNIWNSPDKITYSCNGKIYTNYLGNYWSDYDGSDANGDCIGDTPYIIRTPYQDNYPLMKPFNSQYGDVSGNGTISAYDASLVLQYVVGLITFSPEQQEAADVTGDGTVTALDVALILQYTVGLITQFPVQQGAPIFTVEDENRVLTKIIAELENVFLTTEQEHVLEQLRNLIGQQSLPSHTALLQNYPNPFNPETWLPYQLAKDASVTIRIYNVKGRLIRTLDLGNKNAGVYAIKDKAAHWDGKNSLGQSVASGVYFYTLQVERQRNPDGDGAGIFTATRKMVILK